MPKYQEPDFEVVRRTLVKRVDGTTAVLQRRHTRSAVADAQDYLALTLKGETAYYRFDGRPGKFVDAAWHRLEAGEKVDWKTLGASELIWRDMRYTPEGAAVPV